MRWRLFGGLFFLAAVTTSGIMGADAATAPTPGTILARPGPDVNLVMGTSDYATGDVRISFLILDDQQRSIERPHAHVWLAQRLSTRVIAQTTATLVDVNPRGAGGDPEDVSHLYVAHLRIRSPGNYVIVAEPEGGRPIQGLGNLLVGSRSEAPNVRDRAIVSNTPTIGSVHGDLRKLTTASPPDRSLLRYSVGGSLRAHAAFVVVFATPKFCKSRTCGPVVGIVEKAAREFRSTPVRFIHVEIYKDNNPSKGSNRWVKEWRLPSEPWTFLVGRDGRIKARFEGAYSLGELKTAIQRYLVQPRP